MNILARQNIFQVRKDPEIIRQNRIIGSRQTKKNRSKDIGVSNSRQHSIDFDQLYNPNRLKELGVLEGSQTTSHKSMDVKKCMKITLLCMKTIQLGKGNKNHEKLTAQKDSNILRDLCQKSEIPQFFTCEGQKSVLELTTLKCSRECISLEQFSQHMFGNVSKISSRETSYLSFQQKSENPTVFYSIISQNE